MAINSKLHPLPPEAKSIELPKQFTYPFCYTPHPLCIWASQEVMNEVARHKDWQQEISQGKMLGVLVVEGGNFLAAFSGTLKGLRDQPYFVPSIFDTRATNFEVEEQNISAINRRIHEIEDADVRTTETLQALRREREERSQMLQQWLFDNTLVRNAQDEEKRLTDIFAPKIPPAGAGDCCAPKLLQYAFLNGLKPLCMGEFWVGESPKGEIRENGHFYPSCQHKCKPILTWMLKGLNVEENPLTKDYEEITKQLTVIHEDSALVVVNKPSGLLSVPGKEDRPSLLDILRQRYPNAQGPIIVHRLDMETSGLMVAALTEEAYHSLQRQFADHTIRKRYTAILEKPMQVGECGRIDLLICPNPYDRPRQIVNEEYGKRSITNYEVADNVNGHAVVRLWPDTGRTHQLRLHMAAREGLNNPIVGDRLYGHPGDRLMLNADVLEFTHPSSGERLTFTLP